MEGRTRVRPFFVSVALFISNCREVSVPEGLTIHKCSEFVLALNTIDCGF